MANKYWVGGNGVYSDDLNHWALASGGAGGVGNKPSNADIAIFDINSGGGICTIDEAVNILGLDMKVNNTTAILQGNYIITIGILKHVINYFYSYDFSKYISRV